MSDASVPPAEPIDAGQDPSAQQDRVLCPVHGLWYDQTLHSGCIICRRPAQQEPTRAPRERRWPVLLALCCSALLFGYVLQGGSVLQAFGLRVDRPLVVAKVASSTTPPTPAAASAGSEPLAGSRAQPVVAGPPSDECAQRAHGPVALVGRAHRPTRGLHGAAAAGDVARIVQETDLDLPIDERDDRGRTPLIWAILSGKRQAALTLIREGADPNATTRARETPLMLAALSGDAEVVKALLAAGAHPQERSERGETALMLAAKGGKIDALRALAGDAATHALTSEHGLTALHYAASSTHCSEGLSVLLQHGAPPNPRGRQGETPLLLALGVGYVDNARVLLAHGATLGLRDHRGLGAFDYVVRPRSVLGAELAAQLRQALAWLIAQGADRRLALDPATTPIAFRDELNALALREGRPLLAPYVGAPASPPVERKLGREGTKEVTLASRPLFSGVPTRRSTELPTWLFPEALLGVNGWTRVPNVVRRVVLRWVVPLAGQTLELAGSADGAGAFTVDDALLIESMRYAERIEAAFIGRMHEARIGQVQARRIGRASTRFVPSELDLTAALTTDRGADRIVISALDFGGAFSASPLHLIVRGPSAQTTATRIEIEVHSEPGRTP